MRVTIHDKHLSDGRAPLLDPAAEWWLEEGGLEGWYGPPSPRAQSENVPDGPGGFWPAEFHTSPRTLVIRGLHVARSSSLARVECEDWIANLPNVLTIIVEDERGPREVTGFQSATPSIVQVDDSTTAFSIFVTCPDPIKYGSVSAFRFSGYVENTGRTPVLPWRIVVDGAVTRLKVTIDGHVMRWTGAAQGLAIDCRSGVVTDAAGNDRTTGLVEDDFPFLAPGRASLLLDTDGASAAVEVRPGWL